MSLASVTPQKHTQFITLRNEKRLCYAEYGDPNGQPLLYFHGWPSSRLQAKAIDQIAREIGIRVISPDRPGLGRSDHHAGRKLKDWPNFISELLDGMGIQESVHLMGVSGGGPYALATSVALEARIASTTIVCGAPPLNEIQDQRDLLWVYRALLKARPVMPYLIKSAIPVTRWIATKNYDEPPLSWFVKTLSKADQTIFKEDDTTDFALYSFRESLALDGIGLLDDADAYLERWNLNYSQIKHPVHFWHGTDDHNIPVAMAKHLAQQIPNCVTHWMEGDGHYTVPIKHARAILQTAKNCS